jgi:hypothetical protein
MRAVAWRALGILAVVVVVGTGFAAWNPLKYVYLRTVATAFPVLPVGVALLLAASALAVAGKTDTKVMVVGPAGILLIFVSILYVVAVRSPAKPTARALSPDHRYEAVIEKDAGDGSFEHVVVVLRTRDGLLSRQTPVELGCTHGWSTDVPVKVRFAGARTVELIDENGVGTEATLDPASFVVHPVRRLACDAGP